MAVPEEPARLPSGYGRNIGAPQVYRGLSGVATVGPCQGIDEGQVDGLSDTAEGMVL